MKNFIKKLKIKRHAISFLAALHFYGNPSKKLKIIGVTGTNGKTTVATLLYRIATTLGHKSGLIGTVENRISGEVIPSTHTTPGPIALYELLNRMVEAKCEYVFMEVSSHALDQGRVRGIDFVGGVFTNLTHDHLDYHKSIKNYFLAKKKFFNMLGCGAFALSNIDDEHGKKMLENIKAKSYSYSFLDNTAHFKGEIKNISIDGLELVFDGKDVKSNLLGRFNAYNLLSVWSVCELLSFDMEKVAHILQNIEPPKGRFDHFVTDQGVLVIVDFAHTPDALEKVLSTIKEFNNAGKIISVFGCGGDRDPLKRRIMGKIGATYSDVAIFTADNPRSENPDKIIEEMQTDLSVDTREKVLAIPDRREAIEKSLALAKKGDIILCAGKGHETYQEIKGIKHAFNDLEEYQALVESYKVIK